MNQGYEVIEYLLGNRSSRRDHGVLQEKLGALYRGRAWSGSIRPSPPSSSGFTCSVKVKPLGLRELAIVSRIVGSKRGLLCSRAVITPRRSTTFSTVKCTCIRTTSRLMTLRRGQVFGEMG